MLIAIFSDIHGNQYAMREFQKQLEIDSPDRIYFLGDIFGYYYGQHECLSILRQFNNLYCVLGNHDDMFLQSLHDMSLRNKLVMKYGQSYRNISKITDKDVEFLLSLPHAIETCIDGISLHFCHGSLEDTLNGRIYPDTFIKNKNLYNAYDYVFIGHTHHKMCMHISDTYICNPGSLGQQRDGKGCSYILFDTISKKLLWKIVSYDINLLVKDINLYDKDKFNFIEVLYRKNS